MLRRHTPPVRVPILKTTAFDLMTRSRFMARTPAEPEHWTIDRDTRKIGETVEPSRSDVRPNTTTTPALGPGHKVRRARAPRPAVARRGNGCVAAIEGGPTVRSSARPHTPPPTMLLGAASRNCGASRQPLARSRYAIGRCHERVAGLPGFGPISLALCRHHGKTASVGVTSRGFMG